MPSKKPAAADAAPAAKAAPKPGDKVAAADIPFKTDPNAPMATLGHGGIPGTPYVRLIDPEDQSAAQEPRSFEQKMGIAMTVILSASFVASFICVKFLSP